MSPEVVGLIGIGVLLLLIFLRMNIGFAMAAVGFSGFAYIAGFQRAQGILGTTVYHTLASYSITVIPLFILMGVVISNSGMGDTLYKSAHKWFGHLRGGLALSTIAACAIFAALCGSSLAETVTIGKIALPEMRKFKYKDSLACGCVSCAGSLAVLIPPSMGFLMYGILTEQSIGVLFIAGIIPGIILSSMFAATVFIISRIDPPSAPAGDKASWKERMTVVKIVGPVIALLILVLGGIYAGIFTPTEAGAVGAFGAIVITSVSGYLNVKKLRESIVEAVSTTAIILSLMVGAFVFMKFMTISRLTIFLPTYIQGLDLSPYATLTLIIVFYLIMGMFFDILAGMVLTIPIIYPIMMAIGFDPIWFGVLLVVIMEMGLVTPPIGMNIFLLSTVTDVPLMTIFRGALPFVLAMAVFIVILIIFPQIALFLPYGMMGN